MLGTIASSPAYKPMPDLSPATTNNSAQCFVLGLQPQRDVGYVTSDVSFLMYLWNGTDNDAVLSSVSADTEAEGIRWDIAAPQIVRAKRSIKVILTVGIDGPLSFSGHLTFTSSCNTLVMTITGTRAPQLSGDVGYLFMQHNWADGVTESLSWKTEVLIAHDRTEQRIRLRTLPRRSWDLHLLVAGQERRLLETWIGLRKSRFLFAPLWRDAAPLTPSISAGQSTVTLPLPSDNFVTGTPVAVWSAWDTFEIRTITGVGSGFLAVDAPFLQDWAEGVAMIAPCRYFLGMDQRRVVRFTEDVGEYKITLRATSDAWSPSGAEPETYLGLPVCPFVPSWNDDTETWDNKWIALDNDTGLIEYDIQAEAPVQTRDARFLVIGRDAIATMLAFVAMRAGRLTPFWLAGNDRGFELASPTAAGGSILIIARIDYEYALKGAASHSHVELITTEGTVIRRRITAIQTLPNGDEQLTLDTPLPVDISAATLNRCAWLQLVRLDSDDLTLNWDTYDCMELTLPIMVLP